MLGGAWEEKNAWIRVGRGEKGFRDDLQRVCSRPWARAQGREEMGLGEGGKGLCRYCQAMSENLG